MLIIAGDDALADDAKGRPRPCGHLRLLRPRCSSAGPIASKAVTTTPYASSTPRARCWRPTCASVRTTPVCTARWAWLTPVSVGVGQNAPGRHAGLRHAAQPAHALVDRVAAARSAYRSATRVPRVPGARGAASGGRTDRLKNLVGKARVDGAQVHDARIAALCSSHGVRELWTADRDFSRFGDLRTSNPLV